MKIHESMRRSQNLIDAAKDAIKNGETKPQYPIEVEQNELSSMGPVVIRDVGEENIYFVAVNTGCTYFCKLEGAPVTIQIAQR